MAQIKPEADVSAIAAFAHACLMHLTYIAVQNTN